MTIYLVINESFDSYSVVRAFSKRQYAEDFITECEKAIMSSYSAGLIIEEMTIDK